MNHELQSSDKSILYIRLIVKGDKISVGKSAWADCHSINTQGVWRVCGQTHPTTGNEIYFIGRTVPLHL